MRLSSNALNISLSLMGFELGLGTSFMTELLLESRGAIREYFNRKPIRSGKDDSGKSVYMSLAA